MPQLQYLILCDDKSLCIVRRASINEEKNAKLTEGQRISFMWPEDGNTPGKVYDGEIVQSSTKEAILQIVKQRKIKEIETDMKKNEEKKKRGCSDKQSKRNNSEKQTKMSGYADKEDKSCGLTEHQAKRNGRREKENKRNDTAEKENHTSDNKKIDPKRKNQKDDEISPPSKKCKLTVNRTSTKSKDSLADKKKCNTDMARSIFKVLNVPVERSSSHDEDDDGEISGAVQEKDEARIKDESFINLDRRLLKDLQAALTKAQSLVEVMLSKEKLGDKERKQTASLQTASPSYQSRSPLLSLCGEVDTGKNKKSAYIGSAVNLAKPLSSPPVLLTVTEDEDNEPKDVYMSTPSTPQKSEHDFLRKSRSPNRYVDNYASDLPSQPGKSFDSDTDSKSMKHYNKSKSRSVSPSPTPLELGDDDSTWTLRYTKGVENKIIELMPGTDIYVSKIELSVINRTAKGQKPMARQLLEAVYTRDALRKCSLSGKKARGLGKENDPTPRPKLHQEAKTVLIEYVQDTAEKQKWPVVADQLIVQSLRAKLNEMRDTGKLNKT